MFVCERDREKVFLRLFVCVGVFVCVSVDV